MLLHLFSPTKVFSRLHFSSALCSTTPSVPLSSSIHTWHMAAPPATAPSPTLVPSQALWRTVPTFLPEIKIFAQLSVSANAITVSWAVGQLEFRWPSPWWWTDFSSVIWFLRERHQCLLPRTILGNVEGSRSWLRVHALNQIVAPWPAAPPLWTLSSLSHGLYQPGTDIWLHQLSWDKAHETFLTFLTFLECVANQEWLLMCGGFSNCRKKKGGRGCCTAI